MGSNAKARITDDSVLFAVHDDVKERMDFSITAFYETMPSEKLYAADERIVGYGLTCVNGKPKVRVDVGVGHHIHLSLSDQIEIRQKLHRSLGLAEEDFVLAEVSADYTIEVQPK